MEQQLWEKAIAFHGHACPGLAIGVRAATEAIKRLNLSFSEDEEVVCVTENDACGVDGIQAILSCTAGKGNLKFRDTGKMAFPFFNRKNGQKVRMCLKPSQVCGEGAPEHKVRLENGKKVCLDCFHEYKIGW